MKKLIKNATIVNEGEIFESSVLINGEFIEKIGNDLNEADEIIDAQGLYLIPGMIDDQVHFREPGLTYKGDLNTESQAAVAGGITSFMEMPNTTPRCLDQKLLEEKYQLGAEKSYANYSFYMGTANENIDEVLRTDPDNVCGIKIFLGASTGNMLVDNRETIEKVLKYSAQTGIIVAVHSEYEPIIQENAKLYQEKYGEIFPWDYHAEIRSHQCCIESTKRILELAEKHGANLHVLHLSTAEEVEMIAQASDSITSEACVHHLWFSREDYAEKGAFIKWNPAIKDAQDRDMLQIGINNDSIAVIATDHAPHSLEEKQETNYFKCPSGGPLVQHALPALLELYHQGIFSLEKIVNKTSHAVADRFKLEQRGYIKEGYYADLTLIDLNNPWTVTRDNILYKCGWSPFEGQEFKSKIISTIVNGEFAYRDGKTHKVPCYRLKFSRQPALSHAQS